ncbi:MAG: hypothetical protein JNK46_12955, partial [Methylobacteriaceae bacterium]|nr:hypothetical protein [Methylobacteriaceae bacterium]
MTLVRLAWTRDQVAAFRAAPPPGARLAPLTPAAAGAALETGASLAADPLALIDLRR